MRARKELMRLLAEAKAHLDEAAERIRELEIEAGELPAVAEELPSGPAVEATDDTLEGLNER